MQVPPLRSVRCPCQCRYRRGCFILSHECLKQSFRRGGILICACVLIEFFKSLLPVKELHFHAAPLDTFDGGDVKEIHPGQDTEGRCFLGKCKADGIIDFSEGKLPQSIKDLLHICILFHHIPLSHREQKLPYFYTHPCNTFP